ncbi:MAG: 4-(cytidine 5'-diphospho)-2-C-methyl-D-erythritol kinase [Alphaproteobacteria bacterium]|nr:4-(cytidine 5'-diphospho)-2-C-methyl-D-erythritol kinase [Alphaproteobacteria bacterium]
MNSVISNGETEQTVKVKAPAKVNLYLHVTGRRSDGYHLLDSLFAFAGVYDDIEISKSDDETLSLEVNGEFADVLAKQEEKSHLPNVEADDNIVLKATKLLASELGENPFVHIKLTKNLPVAAGIGGGSADAAATMKGLLKLWGKESKISNEKLESIALQLGADVPPCLYSSPIHVSGVGEVIEKTPTIPEMWFVLVNPRIALPTPKVFQALRRINNASCPNLSSSYPMENPAKDVFEFAEKMKKRDNDLFVPAAKEVPEIRNVIEALSNTHGCLLSRMSGSGATCFGLYQSEVTAFKAAREIQEAMSEWWVASAPLLK